MIPFDFEYYKPETITQAVDLYCSLAEQGKQPIYYSGGTEIISMARANSIFTQGVIDIKGIPECNELGYQETNLIIGSAVTLTKISESNLFPLLGTTVARIADHTIQCKITLGGNIAGTIMYREGVLPLLIADSRVVIASREGTRQVLLREVFEGRLKLGEGEFIVQFIVKSRYANLSFFHRKNVKIEKIDYPLVTVVALKKDERILVGFSGLCNHPFRSIGMEDCLNEIGVPRELRIKNALSRVPAPILKDIHGSSEYRRFVLENTLLDVLEL